MNRGSGVLWSGALICHVPVASLGRNLPCLRARVCESKLLDSPGLAILQFPRSPNSVRKWSWMECPEDAVVVHVSKH